MKMFKSKQMNGAQTPVRAPPGAAGERVIE
jgi:hypothetical protein